MTTIEATALHGKWIHAHEEDTNDEQVFRPASYSLPPSRGRNGFELSPDGSYAESTPGPTDRPEERHGSWRLEGDLLTLEASDGSQHTLKIASAAPDRLVVRK